MYFPPATLSSDEMRLRLEVIDFLTSEVTGSNGEMERFDRDFSRKLAHQGWVGMSTPKKYGGHDGTAVERFVVVTELIGRSAPVSAHWVADRQMAPSILNHGTEELKQQFLPAIARGECSFSIGMSEPDSGSDLASIRTAARLTEGGWLLSGTKVWTSLAHLSDFMMVLCRTSPASDDRHAGMSQMIVDLRSPGVTVNPILNLDGSHGFNEVVMDDVFIPDDLVLGTVGQGWKQVTSELAYERSGPDRWLSTYGAFKTFVENGHRGESDAIDNAVGRISARYRTLYNLSLSIARMIDEGEAPAAEAALVKDLGTTFEKHIVETIRDLVDEAPDPDAVDDAQRALGKAIHHAPVLTIRGGTTEILRSVAAKELMKP